MLKFKILIILFCFYILKKCFPQQQKSENNKHFVKLKKFYLIKDFFNRNQELLILFKYLLE